MKAHLTAITRKQPSAPARWLFQRGLLMPPALDYGCGKGGDLALFTAGYDPYFFPQKPITTFETVVATYVLNVVTKAEQSEILADMATLCDGRLFVAVRRDIKTEGLTRKGTLQRNVILYKPWQRIFEKKGAYAIYMLELT